MPSVISKYLRTNAVPEKLIGNREYLSKALIASSLILYGCKISYPILKKVCHHSIKTSKSDESFLDKEKYTKSNVTHNSSENNNKITTVNGNLVEGKCSHSNDKLEECNLTNVKKKKSFEDDSIS